MATFMTRATAWVIGVAVLLGIAHVRVEARESDETLQTPLEAVEAFAGGAAERCVFAAPGIQICSWPLEGRLIGQGAVGETPLAMNLICEVAIEALGEAPNCDVHPVGSLEGGLPHVSSGGDLDTTDGILERIHGADTTAALSRILGEIPAYCRSGAGVQRCDWMLPLGAMEDATGALRCELPIDGSARAPGSCAVLGVEVEPS